MCGRFTLTATPRAVEETFDLDATPELAPRFNVAPGQEVATVGSGPDGRRRLALRRWGLVPAWARDPRIAQRLINARAETAHEKPAFREALRRRRCLVPADGFYEWAPRPKGPGQPYLIARPDRACFAIAGLWERWRSPDDRWLETCVLLTTDANARLAEVHGRMPVILPRAAWSAWLDSTLRDPEALRAWLAPRPEAELEMVAVSRRVNRPEFDDAECIAPVSP